VILTVTTLVPTRTAFEWFLFEMDGVNSIETTHAILIEDGVLKGTRLEVSRRDGDGWVVTRRTPMILGKGLVGHIIPNHLEIVE
jgi:hypothetical protein